MFVADQPWSRALRCLKEQDSIVCITRTIINISSGKNDWMSRSPKLTLYLSYNVKYGLLQLRRLSRGCYRIPYPSSVCAMFRISLPQTCVRGGVFSATSRKLCGGVSNHFSIPRFARSVPRAEATESLTATTRLGPDPGLTLLADVSHIQGWWHSQSSFRVAADPKRAYLHMGTCLGLNWSSPDIRLARMEHDIHFGLEILIWFIFCVLSMAGTRCPVMGYVGIGMKVEATRSGESHGLRTFRTPENRLELASQKLICSSIVEILDASLGVEDDKEVVRPSCELSFDAIFHAAPGDPMRTHACINSLLLLKNKQQWAGQRASRNFITSGICAGAGRDKIDEKSKPCGGVPTEVPVTPAFHVVVMPEPSFAMAGLGLRLTSRKTGLNDVLPRLPQRWLSTDAIAESVEGVVMLRSQGWRRSLKKQGPFSSQSGMSNRGCRGFSPVNAAWEHTGCTNSQGKPGTLVCAWSVPHDSSGGNISLEIADPWNSKHKLQESVETISTAGDEMEAWEKDGRKCRKALDRQAILEQARPENFQIAQQNSFSPDTQVLDPCQFLSTWQATSRMEHSRRRLGQPCGTIELPGDVRMRPASEAFSALANETGLDQHNLHTVTRVMKRAQREAASVFLSNRAPILPGWAMFLTYARFRLTTPFPRQPNASAHRFDQAMHKHKYCLPPPPLIVFHISSRAFLILPALLGFSVHNNQYASTDFLVARPNCNKRNSSLELQPPHISNGCHLQRDHVDTEPSSVPWPAANTSFAAGAFEIDSNTFDYPHQPSKLVFSNCIWLRRIPMPSTSTPQQLPQYLPLHHPQWLLHPQLLPSPTASHMALLGLHTVLHGICIIQHDRIWAMGLDTPPAAHPGQLFLTKPSDDDLIEFVFLILQAAAALFTACCASPVSEEGVSCSWNLQSPTAWPSATAASGLLTQHRSLCFFRKHTLLLFFWLLLWIFSSRCNTERFLYLLFDRLMHQLAPNHEHDCTLDMGYFGSLSSARKGMEISEYPYVYQTLILINEYFITLAVLLYPKLAMTALYDHFQEAFGLPDVMLEFESQADTTSLNENDIPCFLYDVTAVWRGVIKNGAALFFDHLMPILQLPSHTIRQSHITFLSSVQQAAPTSRVPERRCPIVTCCNTNLSPIVTRSYPLSCFDDTELRRFRHPTKPLRCPRLMDNLIGLLYPCHWDPGLAPPQPLDRGIRLFPSSRVQFAHSIAVANKQVCLTSRWIPAHFPESAFPGTLEWSQLNLSAIQHDLLWYAKAALLV
ncbi:uncharacterized protein BDR25DRAFT_349631 [Lindgomyces ingoldianus]|uniref:Uncharacterized protein n=1 Tax=Lindgomyces ingoldianus TaxID=673940 RepID=A0ACB6RB63_9PLEO|nr:uncharacterized protein BDR25DRAFT_349631 [Lindgomyces ingoldianus]KAF2476554.1 hypothetical protein BDR25DRAFT_349631 [Lindgomyces ingoldianus]